MILFLKIFFTEFIAEMGDKTQLMLIALTSKYKLRDIICGLPGETPTRMIRFRRPGFMHLSYGEILNK